MSKGAIQFNETNMEYYTPKYIVDTFGTFDYDPATTEQQATYLNIPNYDTIDTNGLLKDWTPFKKIWINPPFNFLTTKKFHHIINGAGIKLYIPSGRIKFHNVYHAKEEAPAFGCIILKIQSKNELEFFNLE